MGQTSPETNLHEYSYVLVVPQPNSPINLQTHLLLGLFGKYGQGQVIQAQNGIVVNFGEVNRFEFLPPRIVFQATTLDVLFELYQNSLKHILPQFKSQPSRAFGINLAYQVTFDRRSAEILNKILSIQYPRHWTFTSATIKYENTNLSMMVVGDANNSKSLEFKFNNHVDEPGIPFYSLPELRERIEKVEQENSKLISEIAEWLNTAQA